MYKAEFTAVFNCSVNCLFIAQRCVQSLIEFKWPPNNTNDNTSKEMRRLTAMCVCISALYVVEHVCIGSVSTVKYLSFPAELRACILFFFVLFVCMSVHARFSLLEAFLTAILVAVKKPI